MPLHKLIKQDACKLDEISKQRLQRHVQKLASAARIPFAECALLQDQNRFLAKMNNEAKVRRSTKSLILGKAKVMSYEDLKEAQAKRTAKEKATASKEKRGRKTKNPAVETGSSETGGLVSVRASKGPSSAWRAPVARMY